MRIKGKRILDFQKKTLIIYIVIIIIPFTAAFAVFTQKTSIEIQNGNIKHMAQLNEQVGKNIDTILSDIDRASFVSIFSRDIEQKLEKPYKQEGWELASDTRDLENSIKVASRMNPFMLGMTFMGKNGNVYSNIRTTENNISQIKGFITKHSNSGSSSISPVYNGLLIGYTQREIITLSRELLHSGSFEHIGYVFIDIDLQKIKETFDESIKDSALSNLLIIQNDYVIYESSSLYGVLKGSSGKDIIKEIDRNWDPRGVNILNIKNSGGYIFVGMENSKTGWKILQALPTRTMRESLSQSIKLFTFTLLVVLIATIFTGYYLSLRISKPINKLHNAMMDIEEFCHLDTIKGESGRKDEIGLLIKSFNTMAIRLKESISKEYIAQTNKKKIEIKMLQSQINPHFLYNTLNLIGSIAELNGVEKILTAATSLSDIFRYNIKARNIVTIRDEINQINNYLGIQQLRFPDKIQIEYRIEEKLMDCHILKFLMQPIVENAIYHGIEKKKDNGHITISVTNMNDNLRILIEDDGIGMEEDRIQEWNKSLRYRDDNVIVDDDYSSLGIKNVHYRIQSYYGKEYGLSLFKNTYNGISVRIIIPNIMEDDVNDEGNGRR